MKGTSVLVMGLGVHGGGLGVARWLLRRGARVTITDTAGAAALASSLAALRQAEEETGNAAHYVLGEHRAADFTSHELLVANPAVRPDSPWLALARAAGVRVETEMTIFFRHCPGPILGVTGTKGKTTTASLLGAMLRQAYPDSVVAGNLRVSALEALDRITPTTPVVLELSSFQLVGLGEARLSPRYALVTNLSPDHLNYHGSMAAYAEAKRQIYAHQGADGVLALPRADAELAAWAAHAPGRVVWFAPQPDAIRSDGRAAVYYGSRGLVWHDPADERPAGRQIYPRKLCAREDLRLPGEHNLANAAAAAALAKAFGMTDEGIRAAVRAFGGVEHRLELVRELDGVRYINDTTATNPAAALAALASVPGPIVLIAGGADKDLDLAPFAAAIVRRAKALVLLQGSATPRLAQAIASLQPRLAMSGPHDSFAEAIRIARGLARPGDAVLLSPGCASFGMFRNEFHRGEEFRRIVRELAEGSREDQALP